MQRMQGNVRYNGEFRGEQFLTPLIQQLHACISYNAFLYSFLYRGVKMKNDYEEFRVVNLLYK